MNVFNEGKYVTHSQLNRVLMLLPKPLRMLKVNVYITTREEIFILNRITPRFKREIKEFLKNEGEAAFFFYEKSIIIFEDLILEKYPPPLFYWFFVYSMIHELRHCEQGYFFKKRWNVVMADYSLIYDEEEFHWSEQDAYTYSYRFIEKNKNEIMNIFQINTGHNFYPFNFDVDMLGIWEVYKKEMHIIKRIFWFVYDWYWVKPKISALPSLEINSLENK